MKWRLRFTCLVVAALLLAYGGMSSAQEKRNEASDWNSFERSVRPFLVKYCYKCHGPKSDDAEVRFDLMNSGAGLKEHADELDMASIALRQRKMPPGDQPLPPAAQTKAIIAWLEAYVSGKALPASATPAEERRTEGAVIQAPAPRVGLLHGWLLGRRVMR